jgi:hypothetical protein
MSTKVFITIDTEEDNWGDYNATVGNVENILALPRLQSLFNEYGAIPTYLINYPVASQQQSIDVLSSFLKEGVCEIGTHCHPWNTPPFEEELNARNSMMCNLDYELLIRKMSCLHKTIEENFHIKPVVFRAGRWALNEDVARCLSELGYLVDTSMSPFVDWSGNFGPNFRDSSTHPFYFKADNIRQRDKVGELLEMPPTIGFFQSNFRLCDYVANTISNSALSRLRLLGILDRLQLLNFHWLSPELSSGEEMVKLSKRFVKSGHNFLNMSFHSTSLLAGKSPFVKDERELTVFLNKIEMFLQYAVKNDFEFLPLSKAVSLVERH